MKIKILLIAKCPIVTNLGKYEDSGKLVYNGIDSKDIPRGNSIDLIFIDEKEQIYSNFSARGYNIIENNFIKLLIKYYPNLKYIDKKEDELEIIDPRYLEAQEVKKSLDLIGEDFMKENMKKIFPI